MAGSYSSVLWLSEIDKDDLDVVGKKAVRLADMTRAGFPVPPAFVVTEHAYEHFLHENNLTTRINALLSTVHFGDVASVMQIANHCKHHIMTAHMSPALVKEIDVAYRKFGGFFHHATVSISLSQKYEDKTHAFLNVRGDTNVLLKIRESWAAMFSAAELMRRHKAKLNHFHAGTSVVVQKMIFPEVSGVMLTRNPVTHDNDTILVEAMYGFTDHGLNPDHYEVSKTGMEIKSKKISAQEIMLMHIDNEIKKVAVPEKEQTKQKLTDNRVLDLAVMGKKLEKHYYFPQEIHWAIEKNKIYFTRSKQMEATPEVHNPNDLPKLSKYLPLVLKGIPASPGMKKGPVKIIKHAKELAYVSPGDVIVTPHTTPEFIPAMKKAAAIITEQGGRISQAAVASRQLGIPAIIGAEKATKVLQSGRIVTVNGTTGEVHSGATHSQPHNGIHTATKLYVNITEPDHAESISQEHVDGVGYFHSDLLVKAIGIHPQKLFNDGKHVVYTDKLARQLETVSKAFAPRPVLFSLSDYTTPELRALEGGKAYEPHESNPLIGFRGTYRMLHSSRLFSMELEALKRARLKNCNNLWLMIPFVRTVKELEAVKRVLNTAGLQRSPTFRVWMQVTTPANLISLDQYILSGIDGISIDLDVLISLILGVDKHNSEVIRVFDPHDPAVLWILEQAIKIAHKHHTHISVTGTTASHYPALLDKLVHWGVSSVSVEPNAIYTIRKHITEAERQRIEHATKH